VTVAVGVKLGVGATVGVAVAVEAAVPVAIAVGESLGEGTMRATKASLLLPPPVGWKTPAVTGKSVELVVPMT